VADAQHCTEGDTESCAWIAASIVPFGAAGKLAKLGEVARLAKAANESTKLIVDAGKYDYLFGKVASGSHNAARPFQNASQLARIGVYDNANGRALLQSHFEEVVRSDNNIVRTFSDEYGMFQVRDSLFAGPGGFLHLESTWQVGDGGLRLTTVIPMGG
jgi:filamentous hemagglutinin